MAAPDVTALLIEYLAPKLAPTTVVSRIPEQRPASLCQVRRVGGNPKTPVRDGARIDVFCWSTTEPAAYAIAADARTHIWALAGSNLLGVACYEITEFLSPRMDDDTETGTPRVWATYQVTVRADELIHQPTTL